MRIAKRLAAFVVVSVLGFVNCAADAGSDIYVTFVPQSNPVVVGSEFTVDIVANIILSGGSSGIVGFGFDLDFNDNIISYDPNTDVTFGSSFDPSPAPGDGDGLAALVLPPTDPVGDGQGVLLATITFTADQVGLTTLSGSITPGDPLEGFVASGGEFISVEFDTVTIEVIAIPLPPAALAGLAGLGIIVGASRRRIASRTARL